MNTARGLAKSYGERLRGCNVRNMNPEKAEGLSPELQTALEPLLAGIESLSERIGECNERIEKLVQESYPQAARLKQVKGVGTLIALTYLLTLEDPHRFRKSRDVGCYLLTIEPRGNDWSVLIFAKVEVETKDKDGKTSKGYRALVARDGWRKTNDNQWTLLSSEPLGQQRWQESPPIANW